MKELDNEKATAEYISLSVRALQASRAGIGGVRIPYLKLGNAVRYRKSDVDAWLEESTVRPNTKKAI